MEDTKKIQIPINDFHSPEKFNDLIEVFVNCQDVKVSTRESYLKDLRQFRSWWIRMKPKDISRSLLLTYKKYLEQKRKKPLTISNYVIHARRLLEWAGYAEEMKGVKGAKRDRGFRKDPLTIDQIMELLEVFDRSQIFVQNMETFTNEKNNY